MLSLDETDFLNAVDNAGTFCKNFRKLEKCVLLSYQYYISLKAGKVKILHLQGGSSDWIS
jgi:hypothetical protein